MINPLGIFAKSCSFRVITGTGFATNDLAEYDGPRLHPIKVIQEGTISE